MKNNKTVKKRLYALIMIKKILGYCSVHWHIIKHIPCDSDIGMIYIIRPILPSLETGDGVCAGINPKLYKRENSCQYCRAS